MKALRSVQRGILLLESLVAILIISFGVLGLVGLWANSVKNVSEAKYRSDAAYLANEMVSQMWLARPITAAYTAPTSWTDRVKNTLPNGGGTVVVAADPDVPTNLRATVTVTWTLPGHDLHTFIAVTQINGAGPI